MVSSRSHTKTLWRDEEGDIRLFYQGHLRRRPLRKGDSAGGEQPKLRVLTSRSLSGGGEGLFLRDLPRDLDPPLRQARSSSSLMGVDGL